MSSNPGPSPDSIVRSPSVPGAHPVAGPLDGALGSSVVDARLPQTTTTRCPNDAGTNTSKDDQNKPASASGAASDPEQYERTHVHSVYASIAGHFSSTRHKPWPFVATFLASLAPGSVGLDVGCGNGKYLELNRSVLLLASDRSPDLAGIARRERVGASSDVLVADTLSLPYRLGFFDFAISIAVVHHLSTRQRRQDAIAALIGCVRPGGQALVYVWALEQARSRRGWDAGAEQDRLVPWVVKGQTRAEGDETYQRYYHLYREGELEEDCMAAGGKVARSGYEKDNWWAICTRVEAKEAG